MPPMVGDAMQDGAPRVDHAVETMEADVKGKMKTKTSKKSFSRCKCKSKLRALTEQVTTMDMRLAGVEEVVPSMDDRVASMEGDLKTIRKFLCCLVKVRTLLMLSLCEIILLYSDTTFDVYRGYQLIP